MAREAGSNAPQAINPAEKRALSLAVLFIAASLGLIAYATWGLGITVPSCIPESKIFHHGTITKHADKTYEVHFLSKMWGFEPNKVQVPTGSTLDVYVTSKDVIHGFQILNTNVNLMAVPAVITYARVHLAKPGIYAIVCHEYCGTGHQNMSGAIEVSDQFTDISAEGLEAQETGRKILEDKSCLACHSLDGSPGVGPTFKGMWGQTTEFVDGTKRIVDAPYVREKILNPEKNTVKGFAPLMPRIPVGEDEIKQIEDLLEELK
jgi:cytochrome c oxidase subunit II